MTRARKRFVIATAVALVLVVSFAIALRTFIRARSTSSVNACINNLRQIDGAKQQWALENNQTAQATPSWDAIRPYIGRGLESELPKCPKGGTYILGRVGEPPRCSIGGESHSLLQ
jgi:hypothetical protein